MPRRLKSPGSLPAAVLPFKAPTPKAPAKTASQGPTRRRKLVRGGEHPALAQFSGYPEALKRVRARLKAEPDLAPTAFSWSPLRMGGPLCAAEVHRLATGKSTKVPGVILTGTGQCVCSGCYTEAKASGKLEGRGWEVTLYLPDQQTRYTRRTCFVCQKVFQGEQGR